MQNDHAARQFLDDFFSEPGSGPGVPPVPAEPAPRTRQLRATFREPTTGFPGTKAFPTRPLNPRAAGATVQPAAERADGAPAHPAGSDDAARRRAPLLEARRGPQAHQPAQPADEGSVRGRGGAAARTSDRTAVGGGPSGANSAAAEGRPDQPTAKRRGRPPSKDKAPALPAAIQKLVPKTDEPKPTPKLIPTESERATASRLFREIGQRFNENRKKSKTAAYAGFRHDLMDNLDTLVMGGAIDLKEATSIITNLEQYTKETEAESTETPATILGRWLRMDAAEVAGLSAAPEEPVEEVVEDEEIEMSSQDEADDEESGEEVEQPEIFL
jgi:hypothetical protein